MEAWYTSYMSAAVMLLFILFIVYIALRNWFTSIYNTDIKYVLHKSTR